MQKLTHEQFLKKLFSKYPNIGYEIIGKYVGSKDNLLISDKYGEYLISPNKLLAGYKPSINSAVDKYIYLVKKFNEIHKDKYIYPDITYLNNSTKITITCPIHGDFEQRIDTHMHGSGCAICGNINKTIKCLSNTKEFIEKARKVHGDKYDYSLVEYKKAKNKVKIICRNNHTFFQTPNDHLTGYGCNKCISLNRGYKKQDYINIASGRLCKFYIIKCFNEEEVFFKVGITIAESLTKRFDTNLRMPYNYTILNIIEGSAEDMWNKEKDSKKYLEEFKYKPKIKFCGYNECFTINPINFLKDKNII